MTDQVENKQPETVDPPAKTKKKSPVKKMAPQDIPAPKPDPKKLPPHALVVTDSLAHTVLASAYMRPVPNSIERDVVIATKSAYTAQKRRKVVDIFWAAMQAGCTMFVRPEFEAAPPTQPARTSVAGHKKYTK